MRIYIVLHPFLKGGLGTAQGVHAALGLQARIPADDMLRLRSDLTEFADSTVVVLQPPDVLDWHGLLDKLQWREARVFRWREPDLGGIVTAVAIVDPPEHLTGLLRSFPKQP